MSLLAQPIKYLQGLGEQRANLLSSELNLNTLHDLLFYFPFRYIDKSRFTPPDKLEQHIGEYVLLKGLISHHRYAGKSYSKEGGRLEVSFLTENQKTLKLVWFQAGAWIEKKLHIGQFFTCFGKLVLFNKELQISHPELQPFSQWQRNPYKWEALYNTTEKLKEKKIHSSTIQQFQQKLAIAIRSQPIEENLSESIIKKNKFLSRQQSLLEIHNPSSEATLQQARNRLKFEEVFWFQLRLSFQQAQQSCYKKGPIFEKIGELVHTFFESLPYPLTNGQKRVIKEIRQDCYQGKVMHRLLQGDVGCGKTVVAMMSMLIAADNQFQSCLIVPTEVLAQQHYVSIQNAFASLNVHLALLTGSTPASERNSILQQLRSGELQFLVGTHALLEDTVQFKQLGLVVIDEQHRFGVEQRATLLKKATLQPHALIMTATPIPRTLALTLYSDLDYSVIDEMPHGRKPIQTLHRWDKQVILAYQFIQQELNKGRQAYIVFPLIEESEKLNYDDLLNGYEEIKSFFDQEGNTISLLHGKMSKELKDANMHRFLSGQTKIMVATTVVEVGVDVPNATVILIKNAEKFGLAQLHQLRGRVGRSHHQSYCILITAQPITPVAEERIRTMTSTNDGFKIAEKDLELRGPGDIQGTRQSGDIIFKLLDPIHDQATMMHSKQQVTDIIHQDPTLSLPLNKPLLRYIQEEKNSQNSWMEIA